MERFAVYLCYKTWYNRLPRIRHFHNNHVWLTHLLNADENIRKTMFGFVDVRAEAIYLKGPISLHFYKSYVDLCYMFKSQQV